MPVIEFIAGANTYNFSGSVSKIYLGGSGLGLTPVDNYTTSGPIQHGATYIDFRMPVRTIGLNFMFVGSNATEYDANRKLVKKVFRPRKPSSPLKLRFTTDSGEVYQLDVQYVSGGDMPSDDRVVYAQKVSVILQAANPFWYNPNQKIEIFSAGGNGNFSFPITFPVTFGSSVVNEDRTISYIGEWEEYPVIQIIGPITNPKIVNLTTNEKLEFRVGTVINSGSTYTIDTRYGYKTVIDESGVNRISSLTDDSDLDSFHLAPDDEAIDGLNSFKVTGTAATSATNIYLRYYERFLGV